jgi:hypothetical protein
VIRRRRKEGGKEEGEDESERTFLHQPGTTSQSESSSEDRVNVRDVHLVVLFVIVIVGVVVVIVMNETPTCRLPFLIRTGSAISML